MIQAYFIGRLTADPTIVPGRNTPLTEFSAAVKTHTKDTSGQYNVIFPKIATFGKTAEYAAKYLKKGQRVCVAGDLSTYSYESPSGTKTLIQIKANSIQALDGGQAPNVREQAQPAAAPIPPAEDDELPI